MTNLHTIELSTVSYADALAWVDASAVETQRVDFKEIFPQQLDPIIETCCGFANGYGGIIVVGFVDPDKTGGVLTPTSLALDLSDKAMLRLDGGIIDRIRPGVRFEVARFPNKLNDPTVPKFAIIRILASPVAPHEVLPQHIFPVRRDRRSDRLGLPEIEAMLKTRDGMPLARDLWTRIPEQSLVQYRAHLAELYGPHIGVTVSPIDAHLADFEHSRSDDDFVIMLMRRIKSKRKLHPRPEENGILISEGAGDLAARTQAPFLAVLTGTGSASARLRIGYWKQFMQDAEDLASLLAVVFNLTARYYRRKRFGSAASVRVAIINPGQSSRPMSVLPEFHDLTTEIDLSSTFQNAVGRFVERLWRRAGTNPTPAAVEALLAQVWQRSFRTVPTERPWYT